jgi:hypothetical protein
MDRLLTHLALLVLKASRGTTCKKVFSQSFAKKQAGEYLEAHHQEK